ncbi:MAG: hypothetical protein UGE23_07915 [Peptococcaceae bacterium]|nr:hypothetical protein [Peptococcaceae bacterium]
MAVEKSLRVERLKERAKHCCCRYCGGALHVRQIVFYTQADARIELYCDQCQKIEYGVEKEIYDGAKSLVATTAFNHFPDMEDNEQRLQINIAKVCDLTTWQLKHLGLLTDRGFNVSVHPKSFESDLCTTFDEDSLEKLLEEASQWQTQSSQQKD